MTESVQQNNCFTTSVHALYPCFVFLCNTENIKQILSILVTPKCILWQTGMAQIKCIILRHLIGSTLLAKTKRSSGNEIQFYLEIKTCDPSNQTVDHPKFTRRLHQSIKGRNVRQEQCRLEFCLLN